MSRTYTSARDVDGTEPSWIRRDWLGYRWSAWMPLMAAHPLALAQLPSFPGLYRVRRVDRPGELLWIGWAERGVRETAERLCRQIHLPVEPYDDQRNPARALWLLRRNEAASYEISGVALPSGDDANYVRAARSAYGGSLAEEQS